MDPIESGSHSFIVRIWIEETAEEAGTAIWRGHITHLLTGERRYFQDLDAMGLFIALYLERMGANPGRHWQLIQSLNRLKLYLKGSH